MKLPGIKFHEYLFSGCRGKYGQTDMANLIGVFIFPLIFHYDVAKDVKMRQNEQ